MLRDDLAPRPHHLTTAFFDRSVHAIAPALIGAELLVDGVGGTRQQARARKGERGAGVGSEPVDEDEQAQPDDVDEVPVPGGRLEAEVLLGREVTGERAHQAHEQEDRSDQDVRAVEAGRHEERRAVDVAFCVGRDSLGRAGARLADAQCVGVDAAH